MKEKQGNERTKVEEIKKVQDVDTLIIKEIGQIGRHQIRSLIIIFCLVLYCGLTVEFLFTTARIPTRCVIPECENKSEAEFSPPWLHNAVPKTNSGSFDNCLRFAASNATFIEIYNQTCPAKLFDDQNLVSCQEFVYEHQNSVVYDFDLACDEWRRTLIGFAKMVAAFIGIPVAGFVSDRWGRRITLTFCILTGSVFNLVRYWITSYNLFVAFEFLSVALGGGLYSTSYVLAMETVGPKYRVYFGALLSSTLSVGEVGMGALAWGLSYWKSLVLAIYIPGCLLVLLSLFASESVRWYISTGRIKEAEKLLNDVAKTNKKPLSDNISRDLQNIIDHEKEKKTLKTKENIYSEPWLIVLVFKHKPMLLRCVIVPILWITFTFIYYGMAFSSVITFTDGNVYVNFMAVASVDIPSFLITLFLLDRFGRKPVISGAYLISAASIIAYIFIPKANHGASLAVYLVAKGCICVTISGVYIYTAELFPTIYRHRLFAFSSTIGRIGSSVAPLVPAFGERLPYIAFAFMSILSGLLVLITPETLGSKFPDTMEEAAEMGSLFHKKKNSEATKL